MKTKIRTFLRTFLQVFISAFRQFWVDDCYNKASALTFYTLQSIVPLLAFSLGIAKGFGFDQFLEELIKKEFQGQQEVMTYAIQIAYATLNQSTHFVVIGLGVLFLFWAVINLLGYIESALNEIWRIKEGRPFFKKVNDYLGTLLITVVIFTVSSGLTVYLATALRQAETYPIFNVLSGPLLFLLKLVPWALSCFLFFFLFFIIPNQKLRFWPTIIGAIVAGTLFQIFQFVFLGFLINIFNYNAVYGTFAVLPLFLLWLQISWLIALWGAEIASTLENRTYLPLHGEKSVSRKAFTLLVLNACIEPFYNAKSAPSDLQISENLQAPLDAVRETLDLLVQKGILLETQDGHGKTYHPSTDPDQLLVQNVCNIVEENAEFTVLVKESSLVKKVSDYLNEAKNHEKSLKLTQLFSLS